VNYIASEYIKAAGYTTLTWADWNASTWLTFDFTAVTATIGGSDAGMTISHPSITSVGNGWYLISAVFNVTAIGRSWPLRWVPNDTSNTPDGVSGFYIYGAALSAVTYETTPRPGDQVITTSAAYYGPRFDYPGGSADGLLVEGARTNLYLNSAVPALQTITVANSSTYTISFYGTGSIVVSGAYSGTITGSGVNVLTQKTFVAGSTSLSMAAPTGTVINVQVELGSYATYRIITAGSTITRAADVPTSAVPLTAYLAANPSIWELQDEATGTISRAVYTAGTFTFPTGKWYRSMAAYPIGTPTGYLNTKLTVGGPY